MLFRGVSFCVVFFSSIPFRLSGQELGRELQVKGIPTIVLVDADGKPVGPSPDEIRKAVVSCDMNAASAFHRLSGASVDWRKSKGYSLTGPSDASLGVVSAGTAGKNQAGNEKDKMRAARLARLGGTKKPSSLTSSSSATTSKSPLPSSTSSSCSSSLSSSKPEFKSAVQPAPAPTSTSPLSASPGQTEEEGGAIESLVASLVAMGFTAEDAKGALYAAGGDLDAAANILLG